MSVSPRSGLWSRSGVWRKSATRVTEQDKVWLSGTASGKRSTGLWVG